ncbi:hypothetical protein PACTADRAFT_42757 [Pachysolen tannophilus NRRL Y-2460]|uniref:Carbohydrate kinase PfkB domain-containing protein n=1 Tax=Pachysolen tannophilus NRRL Y-2460 TaxID=669874 RepID=A0A1E4TV05_PACTA|nr:hypothetical protein PACTADRAFT_42757 [Pachysolen tannophilus NRRL Y-2460]
MFVVGSRFSKIFSKNFSIQSKRFFNDIKFPIKISKEVQQALSEKKPIVSLESTIITHGLPYPKNLLMAQDVEKVIRDNGCVPATIAFIDGIPSIGLDKNQFLKLSNNENEIEKLYKISRRDIPYIISGKFSGGTTIASTMILSKLAKIKVFATGGLGGVHKHGEITMDISADLEELSKTSVAVVCSGPKSILDVPKTIEYLETKGVPVATYNPTLKKNDSETFVPGFYCQSSGVKSPFAFDDFLTPAKMIFNGRNLNLENGYLFCIPPPENLALDSSFINKIIDDAQLEAESLNIHGKALTPFLLNKINSSTGGESVRSNVGFVINNAKCASEIAKNLNNLELEKHSYSNIFQFQPSSKILQKTNIINKLESKKNQFFEKTNAVIIGSIALDSTCILNPNHKLYDSNPGKSKQTVGGVGFNVTLASNVVSLNKKSDPNLTKPRLISIVSNDSSASKIIEHLKKNNIESNGIYISKEENFPGSAQYTSIHSSDGNLIIACADMDIIECLPSKHVMAQLELLKPKWVLMDSNISIELMEAIVIASIELDFQIIYEPTSIIKSFKISKAKNLKIYPNNQIKLATPTIKELDTIYENFEKMGKFDDLDNWFPIIDSIKTDDMRFQENLKKLSNNFPILKEYMKNGIFIKSFKLLPYINNLILKDGENGILLIQLLNNVNRLDSQKLKQYNMVFSRGKKFTENNIEKQLGVLIQYMEIPNLLQKKDIKSVTGAGDSLVGYILSKLNNNEENWLFNLEKEIDITTRQKNLVNCQTCAALSLLSNDSINVEMIKDLE